MVAFLSTLIIYYAQRLVPDVPPQRETPRGEVTPIPCHSHNDFWREVPLITALQAGCIGVEADVWAYEGELFVAHNRDALAPNQTFKKLYIDSLTHEIEAKIWSP